MPEISLDGTPLDPGWVLATMHFPNDKNLRDRYFAVHRIRLEVLDAKESELFQVDAQTLRLLIEAPGYDQLKVLVSETAKRGIVAGDILAAMYLMDRFSIPEPSINKAIYVSRQFARKVRYGDDTKMPGWEQNIKNCWREFRPVAHLWAAFRLNQAYPFTPERTTFSSGFADFLEVASGLLNFGFSFIPLRAKPRRPILDPSKSWALPATVQANHLDSDRLPDRLIKILKNYKAP
jgi:hypothetical protein